MQWGVDVGARWGVDDLLAATAVGGDGAIVLPGTPLPFVTRRRGEGI
jgi:hypothetical protein